MYTSQNHPFFFFSKAYQPPSRLLTPLAAIFPQGFRNDVLPAGLYSSSWQLPVKVKVKLSRYRPREDLGVPGGWGSRISGQSAHEGGKVVTPKHRPSLPQEGFLVLISVRGWVSPGATMRPEGLSHWNISVTPSGIEPATFRLVAQCLNQLCNYQFFIQSTSFLPSIW